MKASKVRKSLYKIESALSKASDKLDVFRDQQEHLDLMGFELDGLSKDCDKLEHLLTLASSQLEVIFDDVINCKDGDSDDS